MSQGTLGSWEGCGSCPLPSVPFKSSAWKEVRRSGSQPLDGASVEASEELLF